MLDLKLFSSGDALPNGMSLGARSRIYAAQLDSAPGAVIGDNTIIVGEHVVIGRDARIGPDCDVRSRMVAIEEGTEVGPRCRVLVADEFQIGVASRISWDSQIVARRFVAGSFLYTGQNLSVGHGGTTESTADVSIGNRVALGPHNILNANCRITLEDQVGSGSFVTFWTHGYHFGHSILDGFTFQFKPIVVRRNVWLGYHVALLPGVEIGENSIIAAGAIVNKHLPSDCLAAGVPARVKGRLQPKPVSPANADSIVLNLIEEWSEGMKWKGLTVRPLLDQGTTVISQVTNQLEYVSFVPHDCSAPPPDAERRIIISVSARDRLRESLPRLWTLFEMRTGTLSGAITDVSEDLRDFFRRHTLPCGTQRVLRSIEPEPFRQLRSFQ